MRMERSRQHFLGPPFQVATVTHNGVRQREMGVSLSRERRSLEREHRTQRERAVRLERTQQVADREAFQDSLARYHAAVLQTERDERPQRRQWQQNWRRRDGHVTADRSGDGVDGALRDWFLGRAPTEADREYWAIATSSPLIMPGDRAWADPSVLGRGVSTPPRSGPEPDLLVGGFEALVGGADGASTDCSICVDDMSGAHAAEEGTPAAVARTPCAHLFHLTCLKTWLSKSRTCPLCRAPVP
jgi:hypothetical protein